MKNKNKIESIKEYGIDLEKQYKEAEAKLGNLKAKIDKRFLFLIKEKPDYIVYQDLPAKYFLNRENHIPLTIKLSIIKEIERLYVEESGKQYNMFD